MASIKALNDVEDTRVIFVDDEVKVRKGVVAKGEKKLKVDWREPKAAVAERGLREHKILPPHGGQQEEIKPKI